MNRLSTAVLALTLAGGAQAASVSYNFTNPLQGTEISQTNMLGYFDSSLGTLTGISLALTGDMNTLLSIKNDSTVTSHAESTAVVKLYFDSSVAGIDSLISGTPLALSAGTGVQSIAAGSTYTTALLSQTGSLGPYDLLSLASVLGVPGGGTFDLSCSSLTGLNTLGGGGQITFSQTTNAGCGASIVYTYDPSTPPPTGVPEPASLALTGLALVGLAVVKRRRKA